MACLDSEGTIGMVACEMDDIVPLLATVTFGPCAAWMSVQLVRASGSR